MIAHPCARLSLVIVLLMLASAGRAELRDRVMVLDDDYTSVRELHRRTVKPGRQVLRFPYLPQSLDPASLALRNRRGRLKVVSWKPLGPLPDGPAQASLWPPSPAGSSAQRSQGWGAECDLDARGELTLELSYLCTNFPWSAQYDLGLRFTRDLQEQVSCDMRAQVRIQNPTDSIFSNCVLRLLQPYRASSAVPKVREKAPGFLAADPDNPLADLWAKRPADHGIRRTYRLPERVTLEPRQSLHVTLLDAKRSRATRLYRYREGGGTGRGADGGFHRIMRIHNTSENGLGWALPSGPVSVFAAGNRRPLTEVGFLTQTEVGEYVEIDLGPSRDLRSEVLPEERGSRRKGQREIRTQVRIHNDFPFDVPVQWEHDPDSSLQWRLLNCNVDSEIRNGRLLLNSRVPAEDSRLLDFTLEFVQPAL